MHYFKNTSIFIAKKKVDVYSDKKEGKLIIQKDFN